MFIFLYASIEVSLTQQPPSSIPRITPLHFNYSLSSSTFLLCFCRHHRRHRRNSSIAPPPPTPPSTAVDPTGETEIIVNHYKGCGSRGARTVEVVIIEFCYSRRKSNCLYIWSAESDHLEMESLNVTLVKSSI